MFLFAITLIEVLECLILETFTRNRGRGLRKCLRYQEVVYILTDNSCRQADEKEIFQLWLNSLCQEMLQLLNDTQLRDVPVTPYQCKNEGRH